MNDLTILEFSIDKSNQTYVTEDAEKIYHSLQTQLEKL